ncbi:MAG: hypothetical protein WA364_27770 [Candidatus Nitrosopolaris sp.]
MTKEIETREDWHRLTGMSREGLILISTGIARTGTITTSSQ